MRKALLAIIAAASIPAATVAVSTQADAGGCWAGAGGVIANGAYGFGQFGRYGRYDHGPCGGFGYGDPPAYIPPAYYEYEPAFDGYPARAYNPNVYYDYPAYRRVEYREYYGPRRATIRPCCRPYW
ncbi:MAG TPA: hypothetical protein VJL90_13430 [Pseudorhodoplanes sp.]|nr:hypothetical protein [Pseudorhodoplanes sp.]